MAVRVLASLVHVTLYAVILAVLVTGWAAYRPSPFVPPAQLLGLIPMPAFPSTPSFGTGQYASLHRLLVWVLVGLVGLHVAAAVFHAAILRDGVMGGILTARRPGNRRRVQR
jgi:cytochrome b561